MLLAMEVMFYCLHRLFHAPTLYRWVHKRHHEYTTPVGISSEYASPVEDMVVNLPSTLLPGVLLGVSEMFFFFLKYQLLLEITIRT